MDTKQRGEQWHPSNGSDGETFINANCVHCTRDAAMNGSKDEADCSDADYCHILSRSFREPVEEWRELPDGRLTCTAFVAIGDPVPTVTAAELEAAGQGRLL